MRTKRVAAAMAIAVALVALVVRGGLIDAPPGQRAVAAGAAQGNDSAIPSVTMTLYDDRTEAPATVPAGFVAVRFENATSGPQHVFLVRLNEGATAEDLLDALVTEGEGAFDRLAAASLGGPAAFPPNATREFIYDLLPGAYAVVSFPEDEEEGEGDGGGDAGAPPVRPAFTAVPPPVADQPPPTTSTVEMGDFFFDTPEFRAGTNTLAVTNVGGQEHHMLIFKLADGLSFADVEAMFAAGEDPFAAGLVEEAPSVSILTPGETTWTTLDFTPGSYVMLCFIEDPETGLEHVDLGMAQEFTIQ